MYTLANLLSDAKRQSDENATQLHTNIRAPASQPDLEETWKTVDRYIAACIAEKRASGLSGATRRIGIEVPHLFRIGWRLSRVRPDPAFEPFFQPAPGLARALGPACAEAVQRVQERHVCPMQQFDFSKAALRFSSSITKKQLLMGLKILTASLLKVVGEGRNISLDFRIGRLSVGGGVARFAFAPGLYESEGLEAGNKAAVALDFKPSASARLPVGGYTLQLLIGDLNRQQKQENTGFAQQAFTIDFAEVWATMDRYASACLQETRGLQFPNFCRISWTEPKDRFGQNLPLAPLPGGAAHQPFFSLLETFSHKFGLRQQKAAMPPLAVRDLAPVEAMTFSKAASKFSGDIMRDQLLTGYKMLVQQLGAVMQQGIHVDMAFSFGRMTCKHKEASFVFSGQYAPGAARQAPSKAAGLSERDVLERANLMAKKGDTARMELSGMGLLQELSHNLQPGAGYPVANATNTDASRPLRSTAGNFASPRGAAHPVADVVNADAGRQLRTTTGSFATPRGLSYPVADATNIDAYQQRSTAGSFASPRGGTLNAAARLCLHGSNTPRLTPA